MVNRNIIRIKDTSTKIFRIFKKKDLKKTFNDNCITLVKPEKWDDPFDNILMKCTLRTTEYGEVGLRYIFGSLYAQSWSLLEESDALWRIYSDEKEGMKVETTVTKLFNTFYKRDNRIAQISCFIGKVDYINEEALVKWLTEPNGAQNLVLDNTGKGQALTLLLKRDPFSHEKEVRLIYYEPNSNKAEKKATYQFKIKLNELFTKITLDPRLEKNEFIKLKNEIETWGFTNRVEQSSLYQSKKFRIKCKQPF